VLHFAQIQHFTGGAIVTASTMSYVLGLEDITPTEKFILLVIADGMGDGFDLDKATDYASRKTLHSREIVADAITTLVYQRGLINYDNTGKCWYIPVPLPKYTKPQTEITPPDYSGYVYLLQSVTGAYKIGKSANPEHRRKTFKLQLPFEVEYVCVIKTDDMHTLERELHERYSHCRVNGEWFNLHPRDVDYIKSLAGVLS
jgi:hypothetical protein